jgi:hypothetical protein
MSTFKMKCPAGFLVPRPPTLGLGRPVPKWQRFYNWPREKDGSPMEDAPDFPAPEDVPEMVVDAPKDQHHALLCHKGPCSVVDELPAEPKKKRGDK